MSFFGGVGGGWVSVDAGGGGGYRSCLGREGAGVSRFRR